MSFFKVFVLILVVACGSVKFDPFIKPEKKVEASSVSIQSMWLGKEVEILDTHPYYAPRFLNSRVSSKGVEVRTYRNSGGTASEAKCNGILGCHGSNKNIQCDHIFFIKDGYVSDRKRVGDCGDEDENFKPI